MIKEKKKITKYNYKKPFKQVVAEYLRTAFCAILAATVFTTCLALHARHEMIKNIYVSAETQKKIDKAMARQIIEQSDLLEDLSNKSYLICMNVGELYYTAGEYNHAQYAYELAVQKVKPGVYKPYYKLVCTLIAQNKFKEAESLLNNLDDKTNKDLIKVKTRSYIVIGDKYNTVNKSLSAAKSYENALLYYSKFAKRDKVVEEAIIKRIVDAYIHTADIMVKSGYNSDAVRFLKKAEKYEPDNFIIKYKLAIILSDSDPEKSVEYFEPLLEKMPQDIDYGVYDTALMKAANISDLDGRPTKAKYYRYKIHSIDLFVARKVVYKNDIDTEVSNFTVKKILFTYPLKVSYTFRNVSNADIINLSGDFVLCYKDKPIETVTKLVADRDNPLTVMDDEPNKVDIKFRKTIFTRKELEDYTIKVYLYKDEKYKTLVAETKIPVKQNKKLLYDFGEAEK